MKITTGTDLVSVERITKSVAKSESFLQRYFGKEEQKLFLETTNICKRMERIAANFAGKEAFSKAIGMGIRGFSLAEVQILRDEFGAPYLKLDGKVLDCLLKQNNTKLNFSISLSHTKDYAIAVVVAYEQC